MFILIENGDVFTPSPLGRQSILVMGEHIARIGAIRREEVEAIGVELEVIDAAGRIVIPGIIDPHQHLLGESELLAFGGRTPEASAAGIAAAGVTTVVGCLGVDAGTTTMQALLAKAKALRACGVEVHVWTGGSRVRATMLESACADLVSFKEVIGAGEVPDFQGNLGDAQALASLAADAYIGGTLSGKAGVTHIHLEGSGAALAELRQAIGEQRVPADRIFLTVRSPSGELLDEIVRCAEWGAFIGIRADGDAEEWIAQFLARGGDSRRLTLFSDAPRADPRGGNAPAERCRNDPAGSEGGPCGDRGAPPPRRGGDLRRPAPRS